MSDILHGVTPGLLAAVIAAWPALSLMLSWEMCVWIVGGPRALDTRTVVTIDKTDRQPREQLARVTELLLSEPKISGAEITRRTGLPYATALELAKEGRSVIAS